MKKAFLLALTAISLSFAAFAQDGTKLHHHNHASAKTVYTCTMHPEVIQNKPGKCPKCGMDLTEVKTKPKKN